MSCGVIIYGVIYACYFNENLAIALFFLIPYISVSILFVVFEFLGIKKDIGLNNNLIPYKQFSLIDFGVATTCLALSFYFAVREFVYSLFTSCQIELILIGLDD